VKEPAGKNHYAIFVYGTGPQDQVPAGDLAGYVQVDIDVAPNPNLKKTEVPNTDKSNVAIPGWIKNNAKWWADGTIQNDDFLSGIQFMIKNQIIKIPKTEQVNQPSDKTIPSWIKNNAKWWADGTISDEDFVKGIQFLVQNGIIRA
jgi:hypothetical protein